MLIRYGYEITLACQQPTALVCLLSVHEDRAADIRAPETTFTNPDVPVSTYRDMFGNQCRRLVAPAGDLTMWGDATIEDDGKLDRVSPDAREMPVPELPDETLVYLMGSRYCETDRLSQIAWDLFGNTAPGWGRVQTICDFVHNHIRFDYQQARSTRTAFDAYNERSASAAISRTSPSRSAAASTSPRATSTAISATSAFRSSIRWISAPGSRSFSTASGIRSIRATMSAGSAASWSRAVATPPTYRWSTRSGRTS